MTNISNGVEVGKEVPADTQYLLKVLRSKSSHSEKITQLLKHAEVNKGKIKSLSKRNQKKLLSRFGWHWNPQTGKLVDVFKYLRTGSGSGPYRHIPIVHHCAETVSRPMNNMMEAWIGELLKA
jgi:hypothetical protein